MSLVGAIPGIIKPKQTYYPDKPVEKDKRKKFTNAQTTALKDKTRLEYIDLFDSIMKYNKTIETMVNYGLTLKTIDILFDAQYINYQNEMKILNPDANLQFGGAGSGVGPTFIPYISPENLIQLFNLFFNTSIETSESKLLIGQLIASIRTRRGIIDLQQEKIAKDFQGFSTIGISDQLINAFFRKLKDITGGFGKTDDGQEIKDYKIISVIKNADDVDKKNLVKLLINFIITNVNSAEIVRLKSKIKEQKNKSETIKFDEIVNYIMGNIAGDNVAIQGVYQILRQFLEDNTPWNITNLQPIKPVEQKDIPDEVVKPPVNEEGQAMQDRTFNRITDMNQLNQEQQNSLLNILSNIPFIPNGVINEEQFETNIVNIMIEIMEEVKKQTPKSSSSSDIGRPTFLTRVLNYIQQNRPIITEIADLVLVPTPGAVAQIMREILQSIQTVQLPEEPEPQEISGTILNNITTTTPEQDLSYFLEEQSRQLENRTVQIGDNSIFKQKMQDIEDEGNRKIAEHRQKKLIEREAQKIENALKEEANKNNKLKDLVNSFVNKINTESGGADEKYEKDYKEEPTLKQKIKGGYKKFKGDIDKRRNPPPRGVELATYKMKQESLDPNDYPELPKEMQETEDNDDIDEDELIDKLKKFRENASTNFKEKMKKIMNELRSIFGKFSLQKKYRVRGTNRTYHSPDEIELELNQVIDTVYGFERDYTEQDNIAQYNAAVKSGAYLPVFADDIDKEEYEEFGVGDYSGYGGGGGGGGGDDGARGVQDIPIRRGRVFNGLTRRQYLLLLIVIILTATGAVSIEEVLKAGKDLDDKGKTSDPKPDPKPVDPTKPVEPVDPNVPVVPDKPAGGYMKLQHNSFWDSVGLGGVIDKYNSMVDIYNKLTPAEKKTYGGLVEKYYDKFATTANLPTLKELKQARLRYDNLRKQYDSTDPLDFNRLNAIYIELKKSKAFLDKMTDKYVAVENKVFDLSKTKDDEDVTIDDVDAIISDDITTRINTSLQGGKNKAIMDPSFAILSKGMKERIARKIQNNNAYDTEMMQEQQEFINYSLVKPHEYPVGLGLDNPLVYRNKQYEIMQHRNNYANPKPFIVPSMNKLIKNSKQEQPRFHNVIQIDDKMNYDAGNTLISQKLENANPYPNNFGKSRLFNPEYHLEQINKQQKQVDTMNDYIRCGPYQGVDPKKHNQYYQYANIQYNQSNKLNKYPMTTEIKMVKPRLPSSYSLK